MKLSEERGPTGEGSLHDCLLEKSTSNRIELVGIKIENSSSDEEESFGDIAISDEYSSSSSVTDEYLPFVDIEVSRDFERSGANDSNETPTNDLMSNEEMICKSAVFDEVIMRRNSIAPLTPGTTKFPVTIILVMYGGSWIIDHLADSRQCFRFFFFYNFFRQRKSIRSRK
jgi:hypothetical protein